MPEQHEGSGGGVQSDTRKKARGTFQVHGITNNLGVKGPLEVVKSSDSESRSWLCYTIEASRQTSQQPSGSVIKNPTLTVFQ